MLDGLDYYVDYYNYIRTVRLYIPDRIVRDLGSNWVFLLREFVGLFTRDRKKGIEIDVLYGELSDLFPILFRDSSIPIQDMLECIIVHYREYRVLVGGGDDA